MENKPKFLLGYGERLTNVVEVFKGGNPKELPYSFNEAKENLQPMLSNTVSELDDLPSEACPNNEAVAIVTLHPQFIAKSFYPLRLLKTLKLETIGSRPHRVKPKKWTRKGAIQTLDTTSLFISGDRQNFNKWASSMSQWTPDVSWANELSSLEIVRAPSYDDRVKSTPDTKQEVMFEAAIHANASGDKQYVLDAFEAYCKILGMKPNFDKRMFVRGLCFLPIRGHTTKLKNFSKFSFLRVIRPMPNLRPLNPVTRNVVRSSVKKCELPENDAVNPTLRAAIFDGGYNNLSELSRWVSSFDTDDLGDAIPDYQDHGTQVTSALLFGSLQEGSVAQRPYCKVDNYRVLDKESENDDELYDVLKRITTILQGTDYQFVNFSIGPDIPIEDDEVHSWTAVLDDQFADGKTLATIAVGNGGQRDATLEFNRIQVPSDCVNALAVGAANSSGLNWSRAPYSSVGPGRSPGVIKPDLVSFGGSDKEDFLTIDPRNGTQLRPGVGTSFAAPNTLRLATGIRAHFGQLLNPLAIKALLIHCAESSDVDRTEVGWGRVPNGLDSIVTCEDGVARIVYQGELIASQYLRARIPLPEEQLEGKVTIRTTFAYFTETDPDHPSNYTRSGLDITFRPHEEKFSEDTSIHPKSESFFKLREFAPEQELRNDAHKWETTLHGERTKRGSSLLNPVFDIHYNARKGGAIFSSAPRISYALVITITSPRTDDLYDKIVQHYPTQIRPLLPEIQIPIQGKV